MQSYQTFYEKITSGFSEKSARNLNACNHLLTALFYISYPLLLIYLLLRHDPGFFKTLMIPAVSFILVSLLRSRLNRRRPYETWQIHPLIHKDTQGKSMPSRHIFSAVIIAMCFLYFNKTIGIILLILCAAAGIIRIIGGVHYPSDVAAGFLIGTSCGLLMWIL